MSKQIKLSDELYERLKKEADRNFRTVVGQLEFMLSNKPVMRAASETERKLVPFEVKPGNIGTEPLGPPAKWEGMTEGDVHELHASLQSSPDWQEAGTSSSPGTLTPACCSNTRKRCKHWSWSTDKVAYVNSISGETREAEL